MANVPNRFKKIRKIRTFSHVNLMLLPENTYDVRCSNNEIRVRKDVDKADRKIRKSSIAPNAGHASWRMNVRASLDRFAPVLVQIACECL
jgi:hypothetical protein